MKKILIILTNYRISEKIIPVILKLKNNYELSLFLLGQFSLNSPWFGNIDPRLLFLTDYGHHFKKIVNGHSYLNNEDNYKIFKQKFNALEFDGVLYDDNREMQTLQILQIYKDFKKYNIPVIGNSHGNQNFDKDRFKTTLNNCFDYVFLLGRKEKEFYTKFYNESKLLLGGIPSNDDLKFYTNIKKEYILLITNFLGNHPSNLANRIAGIYFDKDFVKKSGIVEFSKQMNLPIVIKQKPRFEENYKENEQYLKSLFKEDVYVVTDCYDHNLLISKAKYVISPPSTLAFKSIQCGIPTAIIEKTGQNGNFCNYNGLLKLDKILIYDFLLKNEDQTQFIENTIEGSVDFISTEKYLTELQKVL